MRQLVLGVLGVLLGGCAVNANSVDVSGSGVSDGTQSRLIECQTGVTLTRYEAGGGPISVMVTDGAGHRVFEDDTTIAGEVSDDQALPGTAGSWSLSVDPTAFSGQFKITLQCD
jgi:hypothetical protein